MKTRLFVVAFLLVVSSFLPNCGVHASIIDYGVYKVMASITDNGMHVVSTQIDSKTPGLGSTGASAYVADSYGAVSSSWSISPLTANEAQVNINTFYQAPASDAYSSAGQAGEVHFNYHSDTAFTVNYYWDLTWGINDPCEFLNLNFFGQQIKLRIYDSMGNYRDWWVPQNYNRWYPYTGNYAGSTSFNLGSGDWLFIVYTSGSNSRWAGQWESISGNVYLDFDGGSRFFDHVDFNHDGIVNLADYSFFAQTWLLSAGQAGYLEVCDLVNDDVIDLNDLLIFLEYWLD